MRAALCCWFEKETRFAVVAEASDEATALRRAHEMAPDVLVLEAELPGSVRVAREVGELYPSVGLLVLSSSRDRASVEELISCNVDGYVLRSDGPTLLLEALRSVARGETGWLSPSLAGLLAARKVQADEVWNMLTQREREVFLLVAEGLSNQCIADRLTLSIGRIKNCVSAILHKLEKQSRCELMRWAHEHDVRERWEGRS